MTQLKEEELWQRVRALKGQTVYTLERHSSNHIQDVSDSNVIISARRSRPSRAEIVGAYEVVCMSGELRISAGWKGGTRWMYSVTPAIVLAAVPDQVEIIDDGGLSGIKLKKLIVNCRMTDKDQTYFSRQLRKDSTDAERVLWARLRDYRLGVKFRRQEPIGPYIVDFVCFEKKIVIEVDGGQHNDEAIQRNDKERETWLRGEGFRVFRFWNNEVTANVDGVLEVLSRAVGCVLPSP